MKIICFFRVVVNEVGITITILKRYLISFITLNTNTKKDLLNISKIVTKGLVMGYIQVTISRSAYFFFSDWCIDPLICMKMIS